ncbi:hypothetical protein CDAR_217921 [Caerostris darwini]|uniref:Uncharacterized protein n=1 Tax=Caerostris darwini TaxID=1538125 RepID=A0AAV4VM33_9ARAC|nr:hypothetical protein CDAR_217921 [Caerostris darwini]
MNEACRRTVFVYCVIKRSSAVSQSRGQSVFGFLQLQPVVDRECAWEHSPIVERMNSEGSPGRGARYFEVKQPLADVTWSSKEGAGLTGTRPQTVDESLFGRTRLGALEEQI